MSEFVKKTVILSASPKLDQKKAVSAFLAKRGESLMKDANQKVETIEVRNTLLHRKTEQAFESLQSADAIVLIFPLYIFCLPAMLTRFLQDFVAKHPKTNRPAYVYAIVNCGFPESDINCEAMRVLECFTVQTNRIFLGGVMIGGGAMVIGAKDAPIMRPVFELIDGLLARIIRDAVADRPEAPQITQASLKFPKWLYFIGGNMGWLSMARKNHIKPRDILRKPYIR
jgi:hypothetical protein